MSSETRYTISELSKAAAVTPRTIRYYTAEGLLPSPETRGRYALYSADHLRRLQLIARLKDAYLPLSEIKAQIEHLSAAEVGQLLNAYVDQSISSSSVTDYIAQVLTMAIPPTSPTLAGPRMLAESGAGYTPGSERGSMGTPIGFAAPVSTTEAAPAPASPLATRERASLLTRLVPQRPDPATPAMTEEIWQRVGIAPGVELHLREPLSADMRARVTQLLEQAGELFNNE